MKLLREHRLKAGWTQAQVAEQRGASKIRENIMYKQVIEYKFSDFEENEK